MIHRLPKIALTNSLSWFYHLYIYQGMELKLLDHLQQNIVVQLFGNRGLHPIVSQSHL